MTIKFYDNNNKLLAEYNSFISMDEINSTVDLLEYENNCKVTVEIEYK